MVMKTCKRSTFGIDKNVSLRLDAHKMYADLMPELQRPTVFIWSYCNGLFITRGHDNMKYSAIGLYPGSPVVTLYINKMKTFKLGAHGGKTPEWKIPIRAVVPKGRL